MDDAGHGQDGTELLAFYSDAEPDKKVRAAFVDLQKPWVAGIRTQDQPPFEEALKRSGLGTLSGVGHQVRPRLVSRPVWIEAIIIGAAGGHETR